MTIIDDAQNRNHKQSATEAPQQDKPPPPPGPAPDTAHKPPRPHSRQGPKRPTSAQIPRKSFSNAPKHTPAPHTSQDRGLKAPSNKLHHSNARTPQTKLNARKFYRLASIQAAVIKIRLSFLLESFKLGFKIN